MTTRRRKRKTAEEAGVGEGGEREGEETTTTPAEESEPPEKGPKLKQEPEVGSAQATSLAGGGLGQAVGLPKPLPEAEAED